MAFDISKFTGNLPISNRPRTIETVTEEIVEIKQRVSEDFMELGQRLCEAKELLPHGEWLPWLEEKVQFSERTAQKFMALAREYATNPQLAADLGSEKAFALLALPEAERAQFVAEPQTVNGKTKPAADLSRREFARAVRQKIAAGSAKDRENAYLQEQAEDEALYRGLLYADGLWRRFARSIGGSQSRADGIAALKARWRNTSYSSGSGGYAGTAKGLILFGSDGLRIERTWTEVWDLLAVMALQGLERSYI